MTPQWALDAAKIAYERGAEGTPLVYRIQKGTQSWVVDRCLVKLCEEHGGADHAIRFIAAEIAD